MVELELLQRRKSAIPVLRKCEPPAGLGCELVEPVAHRSRIAKERPRHEDDGDDRQHSR